MGKGDGVGAGKGDGGWGTNDSYDGWNVELCNDCCSDPGVGCVAAYCPCVLMYMAADSIGENVWTFGAQSCITTCFLPVLLPEHVCLVALLRKKVRVRIGIRGELAEDAIISWLCPCCAVTQLYNELAIRGYTRPIFAMR